MYRYNECYLFRNYHKLGKAKMTTFAFKKILYTSLNPIIIGSRRKQNAFSHVTLAINAFYD